jgi:acetylserotonin O-methyltransferase
MSPNPNQPARDSHDASVDPSPVLGYINAYRHSKTMFVATALGVFDELERQPSTPERLARLLQLNEDALERLLNGCVFLGLLKRDGIAYVNTPVSSRYLVSWSPSTLAGYIVYSERSLYPLWGHLADAMREGTNRWEQTFGSRTALFDQFFRDAHAKEVFLMGMHGFGQLTSEAIVQAFDLSRFQMLADLGGATGHLAVAACQRYPNMRAVVFDLPPVETVARRYLSTVDCHDRVAFVVGDFFHTPLPQADLYYLGRILHDWAEDKIHHLLNRIQAALPENGALLIGEAILGNDRCGPEYAVMQSLNMLICTEGKERTASEYEELLRSTGFRMVEVRRTGLALDAILAIK